jgi:hypothetical protein
MDEDEYEDEDEDSDQSDDGSGNDFWETDEVGLWIPCQLLCYARKFLSSGI